MQGGPFIPSDNGAQWNLVSSATPGQDQASLQGTGQTAAGPFLTSSPQCDTAFAANCVATTNATATETLAVIGPSASSDNAATSFATTVTWLAVP